MHGEEEGLVTINEGARILKVSRRTVYTYIKESKLSLIKKGNRSFLKLEDINRLQELKESAINRQKSVPVSKSPFDSEKYMIIEKQRYQELLTRLAQLAEEAGDLAEKQVFLLKALRGKKEGALDRILEFFRGD
ncbi:MAG: helix-turn-helix domain-containing protein [Deltaproteobacteria bacterium]|nr:helix-turn-helix domain-containing protein [Deltaproteobacteria bacterium]